MSETAYGINKADLPAATMRATAAALRGDWFFLHPPSRTRGFLANMLSRLGKQATRLQFERQARQQDITPDEAGAIQVEAMARWATNLYRESPTSDELLLIGTPNGGAVHLATATGAAFLSDQFSVTVRHHRPPDDVDGAFAATQLLGRRILARNPDLDVIGHYDPVHDRFTIRRADRLRLKLRTLPQAYVDFIQRRLHPGGTLMLVDCPAPWWEFQIDEHLAFQIGGTGTVTAAEYLTGSDDIAGLRQKLGLDAEGGWRPQTDVPWDECRAACGSLSSFRQSLIDFATTRGYRLLFLKGHHPTWHSTLAFLAWQFLFTRAGVEPQGIYVDCYANLNPIVSRQCTMLPLWLPGNDRHSLDFLRRAVAWFPPEKPVLLAPYSGFTDTFDIATLQEYQEILSKFPTAIPGTKQDLYPFDGTSMYHQTQKIASWCTQRLATISARLLGRDIGRMVDEMRRVIDENGSS